MRGTLHDIFPAQVTIVPVDSETDFENLSPFHSTPNGYHTTAARVTVANGRVLIARDDSGSPNGPVIILSESYDEQNFRKSPSRDGRSELTTNSGTMIVYARDAACGCGSRLRSWNPLRHMQ